MYQSVPYARSRWNCSGHVTQGHFLDISHAISIWEHLGKRLDQRTSWVASVGEGGCHTLTMRMCSSYVAARCVAAG